MCFKEGSVTTNILNFGLQTFLETMAFFFRLFLKTGNGNGVSPVACKNFNYKCDVFFFCFFNLLTSIFFCD